MIDDGDRAEARIRAAFLSEQERAGSDLLVDPIRPRSRSRGPRAFVGLAMVAVVAVVATATTVGLFQARKIAAVPSTGPTNSTAGEPSHSPSPSPTPDPNRYPDGILRTFDGQPVLRWSDALVKARATTDATPFLVAVWLDVYKGAHGCPAGQVDPSAPDSWLDTFCPSLWLSVDAGGTPVVIDGAATFHFASFGNLNTGPAILRVHTHDSHSSQCGSHQDVCMTMMVVEQPVWSGDAGTDPQPFTVAEVIQAAGAARPGTALEIQTIADLGYDVRLPGALALSRVSPAEGRPADMQIAGAYLMPTGAAMKRALPDVQSGSSGALLQSAWKSTESGSGPTYSFTVEDRWLVIDNVAFSVHTASPPTAADRAWLASIEAALKATLP